MDQEANLPESFDQERRQLEEEDDSNIAQFAGLERVDQLEELGLEALKHELATLGMKVGGTLRERAERFWRTRGVDDIGALLKENPHLCSTTGTKRSRLDESVKLAMAKEERKNKRQQGPLQEGYEWRPGQKRISTTASMHRQRHKPKDESLRTGGGGPGPDF